MSQGRKEGPLTITVTLDGQDLALLREFRKMYELLKALPMQGVFKSYGSYDALLFKLSEVALSDDEKRALKEDAEREASSLSIRG